MVSLLIDLAAGALLKDLRVLKVKLNSIPLKLLYKLVDMCLFPIKKMMAFLVLIQNWPYGSFCISKVKTKVNEDDLIMIASLIQKRQCGSIKLFMLNYDKFRQLDERVTDAFLKIVTSKDSLLSVDQYNPENTTRSYTGAVNHARNLLCLGENYDENYEGNEGSSWSFESAHNCESCIAIEMELVINGNNVNTVKNTLKYQNRTVSSTFKIIVSSLHFDYVTTTEIAKVLQLVDHNQLYAVDLSFNCLSNYNGKRLQLVCNELKNCFAIKKICFAYNSIDSIQCAIITDCLTKLPNLQCVDLSQNKLGQGLVDLIGVGLTSEYITTLLLSGCVVNTVVMESLINCTKLTNLQMLKLDQNPTISVSIKTFKSLLIRFKTTLKYLDISSCDLHPDAIRSICLQLVEHIKLNVLFVWPNPGINSEYIKHELLPILRCLPCLRKLPPLKNIE